jgi:hypothetical protein
MTGVARWLAAAALIVFLTAGASQAQEIRDRKTLEAETNRAARLGIEGKLKEALPVARRVVDAAEKLYGADAIETAKCLDLLSQVYQNLE